MESNQMNLIIGVAITAIIFVAVIMAGTMMGGTIDNVEAAQTGQFSITFNDNPLDGDKVTIIYGDHSETYEFDTDGEITEGNIRVVPATH